MNLDCFKNYADYKRACAVPVRTISEAEAMSLDQRSAQLAFKAAVKVLIASNKCVEKRKWVRDNCYAGNQDHGHEQAILVAQHRQQSSQASVDRIGVRLVALKAEEERRRLINAEESDVLQTPTVNTNTNARRRRQKRKQIINHNNARKAADEELERWYAEVIQEEAAEAARHEEGIQSLRKDFQTALLEGTTSKHKWLATVLGAKHVLISFMLSIRPEISMDQDVPFRKFLALNVRTREMSPSLRAKIRSDEISVYKRMESNILTMLYEGNDPLIDQYALNNDLNNIEDTVLPLIRMNLHFLSPEKTTHYLRKFRENDNDFIFVNGLSFIIHSNHADKSLEYVREHIRWNLFPPLRDDVVNKLFSMFPYHTKHNKLSKD